MEAMNGWQISFPMHESLMISSQEELAIRRFCPAARVKQEQGGGEYSTCWEDQTTVLLNGIHELLWSPTDHTITTTHPPPRLPTSEEEEFVDSFFNMEYGYDDDIDNDKDINKLFPENHEQALFDHFQDELENFSMVNNDDNVYGDINIPMMIEGDDELDLGTMMTMSSSFEEDSGSDNVVVSQMFPVTKEDHAHGVEDQGLHLVHLLLACAEAVGCRNTQLADSMLSQIWPSVSPWGDSLQRVSYCFAMGLKCRLSLLLHNLNANGTFTNGAVDVSLITREEKTEAFQLLHQATPYIAFGFMVANDAICQAAQGKDSLHIIDLGMEHTLQWPSLIRTLASRADGPPKLLRITGIVGNQNLSELQAGIRGLIDESGSLEIPLEFHIIAEPATPSLLTAENLNLREGEALFVNSIMHLHKYVKESRGSLKTILQAIKKLGPTLLTVVEQDANHNGPFFLGRFLESLHYYSAIFDSLEASILARKSPQRMKIEKLHFAEEIRNIVAYEGSDRIERHERADQWRRQLGRAGFQAVGLKSMSQARMMVSVYGCDGYTLASDKGCLLLGWKGRPIMLASAWQVHT